MKWNVSPKIIAEAKQLIDEGRLHHLQPFHDEAAFRFQCIDDRPYQVLLDGTGKERDQCDCNDFQEKGYCRHTVAGELVLRQLIGTRLWSKGLDELSVFEHSQFSRPQTEILLRYQNLYDQRGMLPVQEGRLSFSWHVESVRYQQRDISAFLIRLSYLPKNCSLKEWLQGLFSGQALGRDQRLGEKERAALIDLYRLVGATDLNQELFYQARFENALAVPFYSLGEVLDWQAKWQDEVNIHCPFHFQEQSHPTLFHLTMGTEVGLTVKKSFRLLPEYAGYFTDETHFTRIAPEQATWLEGLAKFWQLLDRGRGYHFEKGSYRSIGESQSSMVQATFPFLKAFVDTPLPDLSQDLTISLSAKREGHFIKVAVLFEYGEEFSVPILSDDRQTTLVIWRDPGEKLFFEKCLALGGQWRDQAFYFSVQHQADRWRFITVVLPYLKQFDWYMEDLPHFDRKEVHLQPTIEQKKRDYFWVNFQSSDLKGIEISELLDALVAGQNYIELAPFDFRYLNKKEEDLIQRLLKELDLKLIANKNGGEFKTFRTPQLKKLLDEGWLENEDLSDQAKFFTDLFGEEGTSLLEVTEDLDKQLKGYQKLGSRWLIRQNMCGIGGILADEMGLGKTVQTIAFLASQYQKIWDKREVTLILCPASVGNHWQKEMQRFAPNLHPILYRGNKEKREKKLLHLPYYACLIMSYGIFLNDWESLNHLPYASVILDEAQFVKNQHTKSYQALSFFRNAPIYALTGTPVENHLTEFLSLLQLVLPFDLPDEMMQKEVDVETIREWSRPFVLRRVKEDVLHLPSVEEKDVLINLTPKEEQRYLVQLAQAKQLLGSWSAEEIERQQFTVLAHITRLRQLCLHHGLIANKWDEASSKFEALRDMIQSGRENAYLVFSQFASVLPHLASYLEEAGITSFILDGSTPADKRQELVDRFNSGQADAFLISLKAGGTGLSLTRANRVVLMDLWWNPAVEGQAFSRAHRIGQERDVKVYRLIAKGTIEEQIRLLQADKDALFKELLTKDHDQVDDHVFIKAMQKILAFETDRQLPKTDDQT